MCFWRFLSRKLDESFYIFHWNNKIAVFFKTSLKQHKNSHDSHDSLEPFIILIGKFMTARKVTSRKAVKKSMVQTQPFSSINKNLTTFNIVLCIVAT